jgi:predicted ester cyclase
MTTLDPKALADELVRIGREAIARENDAELDAYFAADFVFHGPQGDASLDDLKGIWSEMREAWTGFSCERDAILVQGNWVAARTRMEGVFERPYSNTPVGVVQPTGRPVKLELINFFRYDADGRLAEEWAQYDNLGLLRQLGVELA